MNRTIRPLGLALAMAVACGCGSAVDTGDTTGSTSTDSTSGDSTSGDSTTGDSTSGDQCVDDSPCFEASVVDSADSWCGGGATPQPVGVVDVSSAACVLEALRDGNEGRVTINRSPTDQNGYCGLVRRIQILADRKAIVAEAEYEDLGGDNTTHPAALKSADVYQKCLDDGPSAYAACLADAVVIEAGTPDCTCDYCDDAFEDF